MLAEIVAIHADEPLFGGAEDGRLVAAPAVRIAVLDLLLASSAPCCFRISMTIGFASQTVLPISSSGRRAVGAFGVEEAARRIDRAVGIDAVFAADHVVFLAVAGRGVDGAGALLQRDVIGQDAERIAFEERMAEDGAFQLRAFERRDDCADRSSRRCPLWPAAGREQRCRRRPFTSAATYSNFGWYAMAMLAGIVQGVVVQMRP